MKICKDHWKALRDEIEVRGLSHLVAKSGNEAADNLTAELQKTAEPRETFDPLMSANFAITHQFIDGLPEGMRLSAFVADICPLCELNPADGRPKEQLQRNWIEGCIEDQYQQALVLGLISAPGQA